MVLMRQRGIGGLWPIILVGILILASFWFYTHNKASSTPDKQSNASPIPSPIYTVASESDPERPNWVKYIDSKYGLEISTPKTWRFSPASPNWPDYYYDFSFNPSDESSGVWGRGGIYLTVTAQIDQQQFSGYMTNNNVTKTAVNGYEVWTWTSNPKPQADVAWTKYYLLKNLTGGYKMLQFTVGDINSFDDRRNDIEEILSSVKLR